MKRILFNIAIALSVLFSAMADDGFMNEHWSQTKPYNDLVPAYLPPETGDTGYEAWGGHVTAGCVATAMAQTMHYWNWPARFDNKIEKAHSVRLDQKDYDKETQSYTYKTEFNVTHTIAAGVPLTYDDSDECKARLTFVAATLGELAFDRDGTGGYPSTVASALSDYYVAPPTCDDQDLRNYLKLGYPVPATITGHAVVLHGWKQDEKGNDLYYMNNGNAGTGDCWIYRATIKSLSPCFPKKMAMIKPIPAKAKLPLTVEWAFPEAYLKIYPTAFQGFTIKAIPSSAKGQAAVDVQLGRDARSYTFEKLDNGETYSIEVTPRFGTLADDDPTVFIAPVTQSVMTTIEDGAGDCPQLAAPKTAAIKNEKGGEIKLIGSKDIENIEITSSLKSYTIDKTTYGLSKYITVEGKEGDFTVKIAPIDFLGKSDNYNVVLSFKGTVPNPEETDPIAEAYAETIVTFSASGKGTVPGTGGGEGGAGTDPGTEGTDPEKQPDYILISPSDFVKDWTKYIEKRKLAHPDLTFAVKNAAEIYKDYASTGDSPQFNSSEMIKAYIVQEAKKGTKYFVLGGAWVDGSSTADPLGVALAPGEGEEKASYVRLTLDNTIPGWVTSVGSLGSLPNDYEYSLIDDDMKSDVVISRIPVTPWAVGKDGEIPTFEEIIEGYGKKVAAVETEDYAGRHRYACAGGHLGTGGDKPWEVYKSSSLYPTERHRYCDGYLDFFDPKHPDPASDGEIAARRRFRDYFAMYNPIKGAMVIPEGNQAADLFSYDWEAIIVKSHGEVYESSNTGLTTALYEASTHLVKFNIFAMPCLTGTPDGTGSYDRFKGLKCPSLGEAAIMNPYGGAVVGFHNTRNAPGNNYQNLVLNFKDGYATDMEGYILDALCKERMNAGDAWLDAHQKYAGRTGDYNVWCLRESILYGDPLLKLSEVRSDEKVCGMGAAVPKVLFK